MALGDNKTLRRGLMGYQAMKSAKEFLASLDPEQKALGANAFTMVHGLVRNRLPTEVNHLVEHLSEPLQEEETFEERVALIAMEPATLKMVQTAMSPAEETRPERIANLIRENGGLGTVCPACDRSVVIQAPE